MFGKVWAGCLNTTVKGAADVATLKCLPVLFHNVVNAFLLFSGVVALFLIAWAGIRMITSGGDAKQVSSAQRTMTFAIVGLIVVLSSFAIVNFIGYLTKSQACITDPAKFLTGCT